MPARILRILGMFLSRRSPIEETLREKISANIVREIRKVAIVIPIKLEPVTTRCRMERRFSLQHNMAPLHRKV